MEEEFEDEAIGRIHGLERRVGRLELQVSLLFAAVLELPATDRDRVLAALDAIARRQAERFDDELESFVTWPVDAFSEAAKAGRSDLIDRLLARLQVC